MPKKIPSNKVNKVRVVYEVKSAQGTRQVDATTTAELITALMPLLGLADPYSVKAAAHLVHMERAVVQGNGWSIRRLGVLTFQADQEQSGQGQRMSAAQSQQPVVESKEVPLEPSVVASDEQWACPVFA